MVHHILHERKVMCQGIELEDGAKTIADNKLKDIAAKIINKNANKLKDMAIDELKKKNKDEWKDEYARKVKFDVMFYDNESKKLKQGFICGDCEIWFFIYENLKYKQCTIYCDFKDNDIIINRLICRKMEMRH